METPMKLISLEDFNAQKRAEYIDTFKNGIACPVCGKELVDGGWMKGGRIPSERWVVCSVCRFAGKRLEGATPR